MPPWNDRLPAALAERSRALATDLAAADPEAFAAALDTEVRRRLDRLLTGIECYRHHPYTRRLADPPVVWSEGSSRLLSYGGDAPDVLPVLVVPSLINRAYVLDLMPGKSLMRHLAASEGQGRLAAYLLDWGRPGPVEAGFDLTAYIAGRLEAALDVVAWRHGRPVVLAGYCMGGLLALAAALRRPRDAAGLALLATPWDFHAGDAAGALHTAAAWSALAPAVEILGTLPVDAIQMLFAGLDPLLALRKFSRFAGLDPDSAAALEFVALEDWLNDGVPLAGPVAATCLADWYGRNTTAHGQWQVAGRPVDPAALDCPCLVIVPQRDRIVPPASAAALAAAIPGAMRLDPPLGHIGMVVSGAAPQAVWEPLVSWIHGVVPRYGACTRS